jgi:hypothetical protein
VREDEASVGVDEAGDLRFWQLRLCGLSVEVQQFFGEIENISDLCFGFLGGVIKTIAEVLPFVGDLATSFMLPFR